MIFWWLAKSIPNAPNAPVRRRATPRRWACISGSVGSSWGDLLPESFGFPIRREAHSGNRDGVMVDQADKSPAPVVVGSDAIHAVEENEQGIVEFAGTHWNLPKNRWPLRQHGCHGVLTVPQATVVGAGVAYECEVVQPRLENPLVHAIDRSDSRTGGHE